MKLTSSALPKDIQDSYKRNKEFESIEKVELHRSGFGDMYIVKFFNGAKDQWNLDGERWITKVLGYPEDGNAD